jgi:hypothetical protein
VSAAIDRGLAAIPEAQRHVIDYETLVARPAETLHALTAFIGTDLLDEERTESLSLKSANQRRLPAERFAKLEAALG